MVSMVYIPGNGFQAAHPVGFGSYTQDGSLKPSTLRIRRIQIGGSLTP